MKNNKSNFKTNTLAFLIAYMLGITITSKYTADIKIPSISTEVPKVDTLVDLSIDEVLLLPQVQWDYTSEEPKILDIISIEKYIKEYESIYPYRKNWPNEEILTEQENYIGDLEANKVISFAKEISIGMVAKAYNQFPDMNHIQLYYDKDTNNIKLYFDLKIQDLEKTPFLEENLNAAFQLEKNLKKKDQEFTPGERIAATKKLLDLTKTLLLTGIHLEDGKLVQNYTLEESLQQIKSNEYSKILVKVLK